MVLGKFKRKMIEKTNRNVIMALVKGLEDAEKNIDEALKNNEEVKSNEEVRELFENAKKDIERVKKFIEEKMKKKKLSYRDMAEMFHVIGEIYEKYCKRVFYDCEPEIGTVLKEIKEKDIMTGEAYEKFEKVAATLKSGEKT